MTKDKKSNPKGPVKASVQVNNSTKVQSAPGSASSVRLLTKIEIKGLGIAHNLMVPAPIA
jgi:hypothetical protein